MLETHTYTDNGWRKYVTDNVLFLLQSYTFTVNPSVLSSIELRSVIITLYTVIWQAKLCNTAYTHIELEDRVLD